LTAKHQSTLELV